MQLQLEDYKNLVNAELVKIFSKLKKEVKKGNVPEILYEAMHYSVFNGGKRIRPIICLATYVACCPSKNFRKLRSILPIACGLEFIHTFSLIQDDLPCMDNDDYRRGKPSLHRAFDEAIALLAADALFAMAFELFINAQIKQKQKLAATKELVRICGPSALIGGQVLDITKKVNLNNNEQKIIDKKKTAELIAGAMKIGAIIAGAKQKIIDKITKAGTYLGMLFQTTDNILDQSQPTATHHQKKLVMQYANRAKQEFIQLGKDFKWFIQFTDYLTQRTS
ncbi:MAG: polyprenyl synthetase family protein [candidate division WOR-3 bacterium]